VIGAKRIYDNQHNVGSGGVTWQRKQTRQHRGRKCSDCERNPSGAAKATPSAAVY
jgi:hypothetical protein